MKNYIWRNIDSFFESNMYKKDSTWITVNDLVDLFDYDLSYSEIMKILEEQGVVNKEWGICTWNLDEFAFLSSEHNGEPYLFINYRGVVRLYQYLLMNREDFLKNE